MSVIDDEMLMRIIMTFRILQYYDDIKCSVLASEIGINKKAAYSLYLCSIYDNVFTIQLLNCFWQYGDVCL